MLTEKKKKTGSIFFLPFLKFHASHLAFPFISSIPGLSAQNRQYTFAIIRSNCQAQKYGLIKIIIIIIQQSPILMSPMIACL